jgi:hypothetical protein
VSLYPAGAVRPIVSNVNYSAANVTVANAAIVPISDGGVLAVIAGVHVMRALSSTSTGITTRRVS